MDIEIDIKLTKFKVEVTPVVRDDNIKGFVTWIFKTNIGDWKIYGGTIRLKPFGKNGKMLLTYDPPAFKSKGGYNKVLFIDNKELYKQLCEVSIDSYCLMTGETKEMDEIEIDKIPM